MFLDYRAVLLGLVTLTLGCASTPRARNRVGVTVDALLTGAPLGLEQGAPAIDKKEAVLAVSAEMRDFLDAHVSRTADRTLRLRHLARAILNEQTFGLEYDEKTRTAAETFQARKGNCLSFSNMFIAMARHVGLHASYQEVDTPPDWTFRNDAFVLNRHVNVFVDLGREGRHVVDFNMADFKTSYERRAISEARALAHYYNNVAVEHMQAGDIRAAFLHFRRAAESDPRFAPAWTNLGILFLREGHTAHAEAAYLQALKADNGDLVAMSNLASLYERLGDQKRASAYQERVADHRERNPYYRYQLAREAFLAEDYDAAISHLRYAVRRKKTEDQFCFLMGLSYMKQGDKRTARTWLSRAEELAATDSLKRRYASKIEMLLSAPPDETDPSVSVSDPAPQP